LYFSILDQINRIKKFYNTTRWLPNSAFTTYFGKPAFENYGYGNTKPVYGGLFYGNYMLSHNMNPIDGANNPPEKQVYSSAMMKSFQYNNVRKPEPPRKTPDEIRNTPEELETIDNDGDQQENFDQEEQHEENSDENSNEEEEEEVEDDDEEEEIPATPTEDVELVPLIEALNNLKGRVGELQSRITT